MDERLNAYVTAGLVHQAGSNCSGGLSSRWATFTDGSKARWGYCDNVPYQGAFQSRPEEITPGSIAEAFFAGEEPGDRLLAIRDASEFYRETQAFEAEYAAFVREAEYFQSTKGRYTHMDHIMDTGDLIYRAVWRGREYFAHPSPRAECPYLVRIRPDEVWEKVDLQNPHFFFRDGTLRHGGRPVEEGATACP